MWGQRTQTFSVLESTDGNNYSPIVDSATYTFDPVANSNIVAVSFATQTIQYLRLIFTANSGGTAGQIAEWEVYP